MSDTVRPGGFLWWRDLACHDAQGTTYPQDWRATRALDLDRMFTDIREECAAEIGHDCPIIVLEGYRTEAYQAYLRTIPRYHAALRSQHCEGRALDLACPRALAFDQFAACVKRAASRADSKIRYIELRPSMSYIHVDCRPTQKLVIEEIA